MRFQGTGKFVYGKWLQIPNAGKKKSVFWPDIEFHCFMIREHMLETGEGLCQSNSLTGSLWGVTDWCHACQSSERVCVCVHVLVIVSHLSITHSLVDPFSSDRKGRRVLGVAEREEQKNGKNRWSESHRCLASFFCCLLLWRSTTWTLTTSHMCAF